MTSYKSGTSTTKFKGDTADMRVLVIAWAVSAMVHRPLVVEEPVLVRGGGGREKAVSKPKLHPSWEGDCMDLAVGACFGGVAGVVCAFTLSRLANIVFMTFSNVAFTAAVMKVSASQGFITVHTKTIHNAASQLLAHLRNLPVVRKLDARRRRRIDNRRKPYQESIGFLHLLSDGAGVDKIEEIATRNEHAVLGVLLGFLFGILRAP